MTIAIINTMTNFPHFLPKLMLLNGSSEYYVSFPDGVFTEPAMFCTGKCDGKSETLESGL